MSLRFEWRQSQVLYRSLTKGSKIRLLTVLPGLPYERLACLLHEAELRDTPVPYKALSYAWNNGNDTQQSILCNDNSVLISSNLEAALRQLRSRSDTVVLWVDSLCINQKDNLERTHQVSMMREIYQRSTQVVIWLGESGPNDDLGDWLLPIVTDNSNNSQIDDKSLFEWHLDGRDALKFRAYFSDAANSRRPSLSEESVDMFGAFIVLYVLSNGVPPSRIQHLRHIQYALPILRAFKVLMRQKWWERVWCVQEVVVGTSATVHYGKMMATWKLFSSAALEYEKSKLTTNLDSVYPYIAGQALMQFSRIVSEIESTRADWGKVEPIGLLPLLRKFRSRFASDERDKVFALLGLVRFWGRRQLKIYPDYGLETSTVLSGTTRSLLASVESLSVLAGTLQHEISDRSGVPSWGVDWNCPPEVNEHIRLLNVPLYNAGGSAGKVRIHGDSLLEVQGWYVDRVANVGEELPTGQVAKMRQVIAGWESLWSLFGKSNKEDGSEGSTISDIFWRIICGDLEYISNRVGDEDAASSADAAAAKFRRTTACGLSTYERWRSADRASKRRASIIAGFWQESTELDADAEKTSAFHYAVECASGGRRFFITRQGSVGIGPKHMKEGDEVFVLSGSQVPFVLRRSSRSMICSSSSLEYLISRDRSDRTYIQAGSEAIGMAPEVGVGMRCDLVHDRCYCVVGDAYVHDIMDGEGVQGLRGIAYTFESIYLL